MSEKSIKKLFWLNWLALTASSFGFIVRAMSISDWGVEFGLTVTQQGEIFGVGLWPFAISIVLFSLFIDRIGYKIGLIAAWAFQFVGVLLTLFASGYWSLWIATFIFALGCGTVEAVINPVVATVYKEEKTKWLNILHTGWPAGLVLGGLFNITLGDTSWEIKVITIFIPIIAYGIMMIPVKFPISERVQAGVPYRDMLKEVGFLGCLIVVTLIALEIGRVFAIGAVPIVILITIPTLIFSLYVRSWGNWFFLVLLLLMMPSATVELATDSWITPLMENVMENIGIHAAWFLVLIASIQMTLRFYAGPVVHAINPLGIMLAGSAVTCVGLYMLSGVTGVFLMLVAVIIYAVGKAFFWSTMLGLCSEQVPKGGALALNTLGGMGMIAAGILGAAYYGYLQDVSIDRQVTGYDQQHQTVLYDTYVTEERLSVFGTYRGLDLEAVEESGTEEERNIIDRIRENSRQYMLSEVAILPLIMFIAFIFLIFYFKKKGGYKPVVLGSASAPEELEVQKE